MESVLVLKIPGLKNRSKLSKPRSFSNVGSADPPAFAGTPVST